MPLSKKDMAPNEVVAKEAEKDGIVVVETGPDTAQLLVPSSEGSLQQRLDADPNDVTVEALVAESESARLNGDEETLKRIAAKLRELGVK